MLTDIYLHNLYCYAILFHPIPPLIPLLPQLLPPVAGRGLQVALVGEVEVGVGTEAAAAGDVNDAKRSVAQQLVGHAQLVGLAEIDAAHAGEQEDERVDVASAGAMFLTESGHVGAAGGHRAQEIVHHADAGRLQVALNGHIRHPPVLAVTAAEGERRDVKLVERELRLALQFAGLQFAPVPVLVVAVPSVLHLGGLPFFSYPILLAYLLLIRASDVNHLG